MTLEECYGEFGGDYSETLERLVMPELVEKYLGKGRLVGITGRIQTGSYEKDGKKVYTTEVLADRVEFLDRGDRTDSQQGSFSTPAPAPSMPSVPEGFSQLTDDDIPF